MPSPSARPWRTIRRYDTAEAAASRILRIRERSDEERELRRLLSQIGLVWPVSVVLHVDFDPNAWGEREAMQKGSLMQALYLAASEVVREPEPSTLRRLFFDLKSKSAFDPASVLSTGAMEEHLGGVSAFEYAGDALLQFLGGPDGSPYDSFKTLLDLRHQGLLADIQFAVRKADVDDILLFGELSPTANKSTWSAWHCSTCLKASPTRCCCSTNRRSISTTNGSARSSTSSTACSGTAPTTS